MTLTVRTRSAWEDRYRRPGIDELFVALAKPGQAAAEDARTRFAAIAGATESLEWLGVPWRWTLCYRVAGDPRPVGYLVPQPARPLAAACLTHDMIAALPGKKLSKAMRESLIAGAAVDEDRWVQWELGGRVPLDEITQVVEALIAWRQAACKVIEANAVRA